MLLFAQHLTKKVETEHSPSYKTIELQWKDTSDNKSWTAGVFGNVKSRMKKKVIRE